MKRLYIASIALALTALVAGAQKNNMATLEQLEKSSEVAQQKVIGLTKGGVRFYKEKDDLTSVIRIIPANTEVEVISNHGEYLQIKDGETIGYVEASKITLNQTKVPVQQQAVQEQAVAQQQPADGRMTILETKYGKDIAVRIYAGKIWKGMTTEMIKDSWGEPDKSANVVVKGVQMVELQYRSTWLLLEKGALKEWGPLTK